MDIDMLQQQTPPDSEFESMAIDGLSSVSFASSCTCPCTCPARRNMDRYSFAMVEDSEGVEAQPFVFVMPEEENESLSSSKVRGAIPAAVDHKKEESESVTKLKAEIHQLERALHHAHIRPSPPPEIHARVVVPEVKMHNGDTNANVAGNGGVHCVRTVKPQGNSNSSSFESSRPPSYHQVSARHITGTKNAEDITHDLKSVLSIDSLQFRLKDDGTGAYVIKIGKGVLKQYGSMEISPSALTLTLRK